MSEKFYSHSPYGWPAHDAANVELLQVQLRYFTINRRQRPRDTMLALYQNVATHNGQRNDIIARVRDVYGLSEKLL